MKNFSGLFPARLVRLLLTFQFFLVAFLGPALAQVTPPVVEKFIAQIPPGALEIGATSYGPLDGQIPVVPVLRDAELLGYAFITSDFVGTTGYSGKPIHVLVVIGLDAKLLRAELVEHSEPIVLIGIPERKIKALTAGYSGLDIVAEAGAGGSGHDLDIISGATVTIMIIDDSIVRSSIKVARALGLGGLAPDSGDGGPARTLNMDDLEKSDWLSLSGNGAVRRLTLDVGQINAAFAATGDARAIDRPEPGDPGEVFIDLQTALVSVPGVGLSLLGEAEYNNLGDWLEEGEQAILVMGRGRYSFKGSGYVRGGVFDRIQLIQGDISVRFRDRQQRRLGGLAAEGAPTFSELDLFKIPSGAGFDPTRPWRLQLLAQRAVGAIEKRYLTFDLEYELPERYLAPLKAAPGGATLVQAAEDAAARAELWKRIWRDNKVEIGILVVMLAILSGVFFFQVQATKNARAFYWFRIGFLVVTLVFIGWGQNAQLSIVNLMALGTSLINGFNWDTFLLDPLVFILWISVAVALLFWGRGAFCGWLCPFGALQELLNQIARFFKVPQWRLPWGLHERLWPIKYIIFLGLLGLSLVSIPLAEQFAEVEPFKTSIILKFARSWPYVLYASVLLGIGLFVERFFCRYLCPLGAALAVPGRMRMFDWLKRYKECGDPCQICASDCFVQAIHPTGEINPNECLSCLNCQVLYQDRLRCPVIILKQKKRDKLARSTEQSSAALDRVIGNKTQEKGKKNV